MNRAASLLRSLACASFVFVLASAHAEVREITVGVTPTCPVGFKACWPGIYYALLELEGVASVADHPDDYNCTARLSLKSSGLPDARKWAEQFKAALGNQAFFRGIEVTIQGELRTENGHLVLNAPELTAPLILKKFEHKLQWNYYKRAVRGFEEEERKAYETLIANLQRHRGSAPCVRVTGRYAADTTHTHTLEVREAFWLAE
jgi:hypothetical protein